MSNYSNRPFFYTILSAFRPYSAPKTTASTSANSTAGTASHKFSTSAQAASHNATATASSTSTHAQITQAATARAIASKSSTSGQTQGFAQAAAAFSPPSHHHQKHHHTATSPPSGRRAPYGSQGFGNTRPRRGSDSSGDEGFMQRPGVDSWCIGGRRANGEQNFYKLSMVRRERSNDRKSCDRLSL